MKYLARLLAILLLVSGCSDRTLDLETSVNEPLEEGWTWVPYDSDLLQISGRANYESGEFVILSWSASSITIAFIGTALKLKTGTNNNVYLDVFVDGKETPSSDKTDVFSTWCSFYRARGIEFATGYTCCYLV